MLFFMEQIKYLDLNTHQKLVEKDTQMRHMKVLLLILREDIWKLLPLG